MWKLKKKKKKLTKKEKTLLYKRKLRVFLHKLGLKKTIPGNFKILHRNLRKIKLIFLKHQSFKKINNLRIFGYKKPGLGLFEFYIELISKVLARFSKLLYLEVNNIVYTFFKQIRKYYRNSVISFLMFMKYKILSKLNKKIPFLLEPITIISNNFQKNILVFLILLKIMYIAIKFICNNKIKFPPRLKYISRFTKLILFSERQRFKYIYNEKFNPTKEHGKLIIKKRNSRINKFVKTLKKIILKILFKKSGILKKSDLRKKHIEPYFNLQKSTHDTEFFLDQNVVKDISYKLRKKLLFKKSILKRKMKKNYLYNDTFYSFISYCLTIQILKKNNNMLQKQQYQKRKPHLNDEFLFYSWRDYLHFSKKKKRKLSKNYYYSNYQINVQIFKRIEYIMNLFAKLSINFYFYKIIPQLGNGISHIWKTLINLHKKTTLGKFITYKFLYYENKIRHMGKPRWNSTRISPWQDLFFLLKIFPIAILLFIPFSC